MKCTAVVEKLLDELLPRESVDAFGLEHRWHLVATTVKLPVPVWAAYDYEGRAAELIKLIKFGGRTDLIELLLPSAWPAVLPQQPIFVPVPQSRQRFVERGYNQAELIAACLAGRSGGVVWPLLRERRSSQRQHFLSQDERLQNRRQIFVDNRRLQRLTIMSSVPISMVLVDDIVTTGATLAICLESLRRAGFKPALTVTLATTPKKFISTPGR
ncbi:MAG: hypothetical protein Q7S64_02010 [bacterium]|nr:hypothetical protein [bacterium]